MKAVPCFAILLLVAGCAPFPKYTVTPVAGPDSIAFGLNNHGHTVGRIAAPGDTEHAFVNTGAGALDIGTFCGPNSRAWGINDSGVMRAPLMRSSRLRVPVARRGCARQCAWTRFRKRLIANR